MYLLPLEILRVSRHFLHPSLPSLLKMHLPSTGSLSFEADSLFLWDTRHDALLFVFIRGGVIWALSKTAGDVQAFLESLGWAGSPLELCEVIVNNLRASRYIPEFPTSEEVDSFVFRTVLEEEDCSFEFQLPFEQPVTAKLMRAIVLLQTAATTVASAAPEAAAEPTVTPEIIPEEPVIPETPLVAPKVVAPKVRCYTSIRDMIYGNHYIHGQTPVVFKFRGAKPKN